MIVFRQAAEADIPSIAAIYEHVITREEQGLTATGWVRGVYPTEKTAREALAAGDLFVLEEEGRILASGRINQTQVYSYANAHWRYDAPPEQTMVLHTLVVEPTASGRGLGTRFVGFYEDYAQNQTARRLYAHLGYREADIVDCNFNGIRGIELVCLEKKL